MKQATAEFNLLENISRRFYDGGFEVHKHTFGDALTNPVLLDCVADSSHHGSVLLFTFTRHERVDKWDCNVFAIGSIPPANPEKCKQLCKYTWTRFEGANHEPGVAFTKQLNVTPGCKHENARTLRFLRHLVYPPPRTLRPRYRITRISLRLASVHIGPAQRATRVEFSGLVVTPSVDFFV